MNLKLKENGLNEKETKVYLDILKFGSSSAKEIGKRTTIIRTTVYDYLESLLEKGFITYTFKSNIKHFQAITPDKIMDNFKEKKKEQEKELKIFISELKKIKVNKQQNNTFIFEGKEGLKSALNLCIKQNNDILIFGASGTLYNLMPITLERWNKIRGSKKIRLKLISNDVIDQESIERRKKYKYISVRHIDSKELSYTNTIIFDNKVLLIIIDDFCPIAILMENKNLFNTYKNNFEILWKQAKEYK